MVHFGLREQQAPRHYLHFIDTISDGLSASDKLQFSLLDTDRGGGGLQPPDRSLGYDKPLSFKDDTATRKEMDGREE